MPQTAKWRPNGRDHLLNERSASPAGFLSFRIGREEIFADKLDEWCPPTDDGPLYRIASYRLANRYSGQGVRETGAYRWDLVRTIRIPRKTLWVSRVATRTHKSLKNQKKYQTLSDSRLDAQSGRAPVWPKHSFNSVSDFKNLFFQSFGVTLFELSNKVQILMPRDFVAKKRWLFVRANAALQIRVYRFELH